MYRYYKSILPNKNDYVYCRVNELGNNCLFLNLIEYNINTIIPFKELSECRGRKGEYKIKKKYKTNSLHIFNVINNTEDNLELSNKYISEDDKNKYSTTFNETKKVLNIFNSFLKYLKIDGEENYINYALKTIWLLDDNNWFDELINIKINNNLINKFNLNETEEELFIKSLNNNICDVEYNLIINIKLFCLEKEALHKIINYLSNLETKLLDVAPDIKLINSPYYKIIVKSNNLKELEKVYDIYIKGEEHNCKDLIFKLEKCYINNNLNSNLVNLNT